MGLSTPSESVRTSARPRLRLVPTQPRQPVVPAVFAVGSGAEDAALALFPGLAQRFVSPCLIAGVEDSPEPLLHVLQRANEPTVFVICITPELPSSAVSDLVQAFGRFRRPFHRLLVLDLHDADGLLEQLEDAATSLLAPRELPSFPELEGFMQGSAEGSTAHGEKLSPGGSVQRMLAAGPSVVVAGMDLDRRTIHKRPPTPPPSGGGTTLRVLDGGAGSSPQTPPDVDTIRTSSSAEHERPQGFGSASTPGSGQRRVRIAAAGAFVVGLGIVPVVMSSTSAGDVPPAQSLGASAALPLATSAATAEPASAPESPAAPPPLHPMEAAALRGEVLDGGSWWVLVPRRDETAWGVAATRCRRKSVAATRGFRLPTKNQMWALVRASVLPRGRYWTRSLVRGADEPQNWVFDPDVGHMVAVPKSGEAGTVCVLPK